MRVIAIGLAVAALAAAPLGGAYAKTAKPDKAHEQGMAEAPALLQQTGANCTLTDANYLGSSKAKGPDGKDVTTQIYEAACQEGLGYMILAPENATPNAFDCLALSGNAPKEGEKDTNGLYCRMEANAQPLMGLQPIVNRAGVACTVNQGRWMGAGAEQKFNQYEVGCSEGTAYVVQAPFGGSTHPLNAVDCMRVPSDTCNYFSKEKMISVIAAMAAPSGRTCTVTDARYVGTLPNKDNFYEVGCSEGAGYIFQTDDAGKFKVATDCARASAIGGGCTLTHTAGETAETGTYTRLAKEIGYPCAVSSYKSFGPDLKTGRELVELACSDHPDGAFAMLPINKGQKGETFNCVRAESRQLKCTLTPMTAAYAKVSAQMGAKGKPCQVTGGRGVGVSASGDDYIEVACSGSAAGYMVQYGPGLEAVKAVIACKDAKGIGGGCKLGA
jgi:hypothetical protein